MKNKSLIQIVVLCFLGFGFAFTAIAQNKLDVEAGIVFPGYNNVAVPGDSGTRFSLTEDLDARDTAAFRIRYGRVISGRHWVGFLAAPLTMKSHGTFEDNVVFNEMNFPAGDVVDAKFRFDSYRLIYRYQLYRTDSFSFSIGGALKIRDASIELKSGELRSVKNNTGFVPLLSFNFTWQPFDKVRFLLDGEALAAPQGRAEDVLLATQYDINEALSLNLGYRLLEGGADNDEVYTFSLFNYALIGLTWSF